MPDAAVLEAGREHLGAEAVVDPSCDERRVGDRAASRSTPGPAMRRRLRSNTGRAARQVERDHRRRGRGAARARRAPERAGSAAERPARRGRVASPSRIATMARRTRRIVPWPPAPGPADRARDGPPGPCRPARRAAMNRTRMSELLEQITELLERSGARLRASRADTDRRLRPGARPRGRALGGSSSS